MKQKVLSWVIVAVMLCAMLPAVPTPALAATGTGVKAVLAENSDGSYKLVFSAKTPTTLQSFVGVCSFDHRIIQPVAAADPTITLDVSYLGNPLNQDDAAPFRMLLQADSPPTTDRSFVFAPTLWRSTTNRTAFFITVYHASGTRMAASNGAYKAMFEFYFKFKPGYDKTNLDANTFKFGDFTDGGATVFNLFFPASTNVRAGIQLGENLPGGKVYHYAYADQALYPDSIDEVLFVYDNGGSTNGGGNAGNTGGGGGGGASTTTNSNATTLPGGDGTVSVGYAKDGDAVTLELPTAKVNEVIDKAAEGVATFDVSKVSDATSVAIPKAALTKIADAGLEVELKFPQATMTFDADAAASIAAQTNGANTSVSYNLLTIPDLNPEQRNVPTGNDVIIDLNVYSGLQKITSFDGKITVTVPFNGNENTKVWYLTDAGELEKIPCQYDKATRTVTFTIDHLSVYIVGLDNNHADANTDVSGTNVIAEPFRDVAGADWYYDAVMWAYANNLMNGTAANTFSPDASLTRGMVVTVLFRQAGSPATQEGVPFSDVATGLYYTDAVNWAAASGIVTGYGDGRFGPEDDVTREQIAAILNNFVNTRGIDLRETRQIVIFEDDAAIAAYAKDAVGRLVRAGVITGKPGNLFDPQGKATRAEYATMLSRFLGTN